MSTVYVYTATLTGQKHLQDKGGPVSKGINADWVFSVRNGPTTHYVVWKDRTTGKVYAVKDMEAEDWLPICWFMTGAPVDSLDNLRQNPIVKKLKQKLISGEIRYYESNRSGVVTHLKRPPTKSHRCKVELTDGSMVIAAYSSMSPPKKGDKVRVVQFVSGIWWVSP